MILNDTRIPLSSQSFNMLNHIDEVGTSTDSDKKNLLQLGEILISHEAHHKFGITLLHKHYDLNDLEIIVENNSEVNKEFNLSVQSQINLNTLSPSMWMFLRGDEAIRATQWFNADEPDFTSSMDDSDLPVFIALRIKMLELNCIDHFGIGLLHRVQALNENELLMENTDEEARIQEMKLLQRSFFNEQDNIQTLWSFEKNGKNEIEYVCELGCSWNVGHRQRHRGTGRPT